MRFQKEGSPIVNHVPILSGFLRKPNTLTLPSPKRRGNLPFIGRRLLFICGTDTGVGKTRVGGLLAEFLARGGRRVGVLKPFASGDWGDARRLRVAAGGRQELSSIVVRFTRAALAPAAVAGLGAAAGRAVRADLREARGRARALARDNDVVLVEGVGGALAPLGGRWTVADLIREIGAPVWVVARAGLGTLNHSLLTLEALRRRGLPVRRLIVNGYRGKTRAERTNVPLLRGLARLPVTVVPYVTGHSTAAAARSVLGAAFSEDFGRTA